MSPERAFQVLITIGLLSGAWLYGEYHHETVTQVGGSSRKAELQAQNAELTVELDTLRDEVAQLRSLLKNGPYPIPEDLIAFVEKDNGLVFTEAPFVELASPAELRDSAERNIEFAYATNGEESLEKEQLVWERIGLIPSEQILRAQWIAVETIDTKGLFDLTSGKILLSENFDPMSIPDSGMLVHLLTRQLLFQNFPPKTFDDSEAWRAWQGIHRGAAASVQSRYLRRRAATEEVEWNDTAENREVLLNDLSPAFQGFANFPFMEGHDYAKLAYVKSRDAYRSIFKNPVTSTLSLLYPNTQDHPSAPTTRRIGALGLRLLLDPHLGVEASSKLTFYYSTDSYVTSEKDLIWTVTMKTPEAAARLQETLPSIIPESGKPEVTLKEKQVTVTITL